jgi:hypothetical protein
MNSWNNFPNHTDQRQQHPIPPINMKVLVEIANSTFDFSMSKQIQMSTSTINIMDITWSTSPVYYQINLLANLLWISGELIAQITYTKGNQSKVYQQTLNFHWKKACPLQYCYPPIIPLSNEKRNYGMTDSSTEHYEQIIYHNENLVLDIITTKINTSKDILTKNKLPFLLLNINCEIFYRLFQYQVITK